MRGARGHSAIHGIIAPTHVIDEDEQQLGLLDAPFFVFGA
jgi:hypothetical protein